MPVIEITDTEDVSQVDEVVKADSSPASEIQDQLEPETETPNDPAAEPEKFGSDTPAEQPKQSKGVQKRIDELVRQREEEKKEKELLRQEKEQIRQEKERLLDILHKQTGHITKPDVDPNAPPDINNYGDDYERYRQDHTKWEINQALAKKEAEFQAQRQMEEQKKAVESGIQNVRSRIKELSKEVPDFEVIASDPSVPYSEVMSVAVISSEVGAELAYYFGSNKAEAARIKALPTLSALREITKIEAKFQQGKLAIKREFSSAPEPLTPINGSGTVEKDPSKMSFEEYEAWRKTNQK